MLLDRAEAADALRLSLRKIDDLIDTGKIKPVRIGGRVRLSIHELERFIATQTVRTSEAEQLKIVRMRAGLQPEELAALCGYQSEVVTAGESGSPLPRRVFASLVAMAIFAGLTGKEQALQEAIAV